MFVFGDHIELLTAAGSEDDQADGPRTTNQTSTPMRRTLMATTTKAVPTRTSGSIPCDLGHPR